MRHSMPADAAAKRSILQAIQGADLVSMCSPMMLEMGMQASVHWTSIYTQRLGPKVKLVGSTINCQPVWRRSDSSKELRQNPHVQSSVMATDQVTCMLSVYSSQGEKGLHHKQRAFCNVVWLSHTSILSCIACCVTLARITPCCCAGWLAGLDGGGQGIWML